MPRIFRQAKKSQTAEIFLRMLENRQHEKQIGGSMKKFLSFPQPAQTFWVVNLGDPSKVNGSM
jgi:hypothetical protein